MMAELSWLFPRHPIDVSRHLRALPEDGRIPDLEDWRWIHTPGHTPGHVSFWNAGTRALLAGDAVITTRQESLRGALMPQGHLQGPLPISHPIGQRPICRSGDWRTWSPGSW